MNKHMDKNEGIDVWKYEWRKTGKKPIMLVWYL